jgi:hypothetical protein
VELPALLSVRLPDRQLVESRVRQSGQQPVELRVELPGQQSGELLGGLLAGLLGEEPPDASFVTYATLPAPGAGNPKPQIPKPESVQSA